MNFARQIQPITAPKGLFWIVLNFSPSVMSEVGSENKERPFGAVAPHWGCCTMYRETLLFGHSPIPYSSTGL